VLRELHDQAHHECFISNSVLTEVTTNPTFETVNPALTGRADGPA
jgi:hypothetical protein